MGQHRLVIDYNEIVRDFEESKDKPQRQLFYQMTRLSRDRGSLQHDDRIDVLAMGVAYWREQVEADRDREYKERRDELLIRGCKEFMNSVGAQEPEEDLWVRV